MPVYEEKEKINGQKRYFIRTYVTDEFGKRKQITRHNKNWIGRDGYWLAYDEESKLKKQKNNFEENISLKKLSESYLQELSYNSKLGTIKKHTDNINKYILPYFENIKVKSITNKSILEWKQKIEEKNYSLNFKKGIFVSFSALLNHGCKYYGIENNSARNVGNFKAKKGHKKKLINIMSEEQFKQFKNYEKNLLYKNLFNILFYTGMRRGEFLALTWNDIDFEKNEIHINKTLNPKLIDDNDQSPKTDKSNRTIKMLSTVRESLQYIKKENYETPSKFATLSTMKRHCDNNCSKLNIKDFRIHDFRHSFASMCIDKNIPINIISDYLGHENVSTTWDTYGHLYKNSQNRLIEVLDDQKINEYNKKKEFIDYVTDIVNDCLLSGKTREEISAILKNINKKYSPI